MAAQNAVRHGLLAKEVVVKGEDPGEFELYREQMLAELAPAGQMESMLAQRIVGLSWRLRRAERLQAAAYDKIENQSERPQPVMAPEDASKLLAFLVEQNIQCPAPPSPPPGRRAVQDFNQERVLDRLLVYERRIEHSLYRTMAELRKLRSLREKEPMAEAGLVRSTGIPFAGLGAGLPMLRSRKAGLRTNSCQTNPICAGASAGSTPNGADGQEQTCETNPICPGVSSVKSEVAGARSALSEEVGRGRPTHPEPPEGGTPNVGGDESCETNPIREPDSAPKKTPAEPPRPRMYPNTAKEMTYDFGLRRWVWTGYALANKNSKLADSGRRQ